MSDQLKALAARRAVEFVRPGMVVGLGSGSTAELAIRALGERVNTAFSLAPEIPGWAPGHVLETLDRTCGKSDSRRC